MRLLGLDHRWSSPYGWAVEELLFGGQAGGGKSMLARCVAFTLAHIWPGCRVPIFRRTYPELEDTHIVKIVTEWAGTGQYHGGSHEWRFNNGSVVPFRHCERESDVYRYMSAEWDALIIDEATQFTEFQVTVLRARVRSTRPRWRPVLLYTANPGGVGHTYFRTQFVNSGEDGVPFMASKEQGGFRRCFLRSRLTDNPSLPPEYQHSLEAISDPELRKALSEGDWDLFSGQFFEGFNRQHHACAPFKLPDTWHRRYISTDWGYGAPWATLFFARDEDIWKKDHIPRWYAYRELYAPGIRDQQQARLIRDSMEWDNTHRGRSANRLLWDAVADPSMWNKSSQTGVSPADIYQAQMIPIMPANNDRVNGWQRMREYLDAMPDGKPGLIFFDTCVNTLRTLPDMQRAKNRPEDMDTDGEDHACFVAGTMIETAGGPVPIEQIKAGTMVWTSKGLRCINHAWETGVRQVNTYRFSNGSTLTATPNHPIQTDRGMVAIDEVRYSDIITAWEHHAAAPESASPITASPSIATPIADTRRYDATSPLAFDGQSEGSNDYTVRSTRTGTGTFPPGTTFTTLTGIPQTTRLITWPPSPTDATSQTISGRTQGRDRPTITSPGSFGNPESGTSLKRGEYGTPNTPSKFGSDARRKSIRAISAVSRIAQGIVANIASVVTPASQPRDERAALTTKTVPASSAGPPSVKESTSRDQRAPSNAVRLLGSSPAGIATVYDLSVNDQHEYYANGILASNSDAVRYFCMTQAAIQRAEGHNFAPGSYILRSGQPVTTAPGVSNAMTESAFEKALAKARGR